MTDIFSHCILDAVDCYGMLAAETWTRREDATDVQELFVSSLGKALRFYQTTLSRSTGAQAALIF